MKPYTLQDIEKSMVALDKCQHFVHKSCLIYYILDKKKNEDIPIIKCPNYDCQEMVSKKEVETYLNLSGLRNENGLQQY